MERVIQSGLDKQLEFDYRNQWYIHNPKSVRKNKTIKFSGKEFQNGSPDPGR